MLCVKNKLLKQVTCRGSHSDCGRALMTMKRFDIPLVLFSERGLFFFADNSATMDGPLQISFAGLLLNTFAYSQLAFV